MIIKKKVFVGYALLSFFIALGGIPYFIHPALKILFTCILMLIFYLRTKYLNLSFIIFFITLLTLTLLQGLKFDFFPIVTNIGIYSMVIGAYIIVKLLKEDFLNYYINILYILAQVSLVFYFSILLVPTLGNILVEKIVPLFNIFNFSHSIHKTVIIYNLSHIDIFRNSGPFWEPGAFAGYLLIAFMFHFIKNPEFKNKVNIIFLITLVTTLSTTSFLALFIFFIFYFYKRIKNILIKSIGISFILGAGMYAYTTLDFLGEKIEYQLEMAQEQGIDKSNNTQRFLSILRDLKSLSEHEFIGRGLHNSTRYNIQTDNKFIYSTVGLTDTLVKFGLLFYILIWINIYKSICKYMYILNQSNKLYCFAILFALVVTLFSEPYFTYPIYWSLLFLQYAYLKNKKERFI